MKRSSILLCIAMLALTACSSNDDGSLVPGSQPPPSGFAITSANAVDVSKASWAALTS